jgi:UDP-N-acetylglucosamine 2-epimerase (non-hydrolysing)
VLIHLIAAARPNFMKIAPLYHALKKEEWAQPIIVHTGQHYDLNMSDAFLQDLRLPDPDVHLGVGSGSHAEQTGKVMMAYEQVLIETWPDLVIVVGDVNSTMAATLAASKLGVKIGHLEAGLRSFDRTMPEEINRLVTDALADILWTSSLDADENLLREGVPREKIHRVGNIMIDSLEMLRGPIEEQTTYRKFNLDSSEYGVVTLHRPSNVDNNDVLNDLCAKLVRISKDLPLVFPIHPRTRKSLVQKGLMKLLDGSNSLHVTEPLSYIPFMNLIFHCRLAITDSGGLQEETTYLGIPCLTMRPNTERPITISEGTNELCSTEQMENKVSAILNGRSFRGRIPEFWDGQTAGRVVDSIAVNLSKRP